MNKLIYPAATAAFGLKDSSTPAEGILSRGKIILKPYSAHTSNKQMTQLIFTARRYASAVLDVIVCPSVCLSVCHKPVLYRNGNT